MVSTPLSFAFDNATGFSRADIRFALLWGFLPNAIFVPISFFAAPVRTPAILAYFLVGLLTARLGGIVVAAALACAIAFDVLWVISNAYNLSIAMVAESLSFAWHLKFYGSPIFLALAAGLVVQFTAILWLRKHWVCDLRIARPYAGLLLVFLATLIDAAANLPATTSIIGPALGRTDVRSATSLSGFADRVLEERGDALLVIVEGYGVLADAKLRAAVEAAFSDSKLLERYKVSVGDVPYQGSTTAGEIRELCGTNTKYAQLASGEAEPTCLPTRLGEAGHETAGFHAFTGDFFERHAWWPKLGLGESYFAEELLQSGDRRWGHCGAVFTGLCDLELADVIQRRLASPNEKPRFIYWLTLNTHIPLMSEPDSSAFGCGTSSDPFSDAQTCAMGDIWARTFRAVADIALAEESGLQILLVGDHAPPSWTRRGRALFEPGIVRWISLTPKRED